METFVISVETAALEWTLKEADKRISNVLRMVGEVLAERMRQTDACVQAMYEALKFEPTPFEGSYLNREVIADRRPTSTGPTPSTVQPGAVR